MCTGPPPDLPAAFAFYRDGVGFDEHANIALYGMADLSAGGDIPASPSRSTTGMGPALG